MPRGARFLPILATFIGIGLFSTMDAFIKSAAIAIGAYSALFLRTLIGTAIMLPLWKVTRTSWPTRAVLRIHLVRGAVITAMALSFFFALVRLPLAEAIALSFVAPLIALFLAATLLGETIKRRTIFAALLSLVGVGIIVAGRVGRERMSDDAAIGLAALALSAILYAWNLVLQRQQALVAKPIEVATFQNGVVCAILLIAAPFLLVLPDQTTLGYIVTGAILATSAAIVLSWAYGRAEAQVLVPIEYTGFLWAAVLGWIMFREPVTPAIVAGAALIVIGCWMATWQRPKRARPPQSSA